MGESASRVDRGIESRAIGCLNGSTEETAEAAEAAVSPRAALFADIRELPLLPPSFPGLNGASRGSSIGGGNPSNVPVGLCQSAFQKRTMLHSAFGKFILAWKWRGERPNSCISLPPDRPEDGASSISWKNGEGGEKGSKQRGRARRPRNCEKSSLRTISVRGFYFLFLYHLSILPLRPWPGAKVTLFVKDWNWKDMVRWNGDGNIGEGSSLFA